MRTRWKYWISALAVGMMISLLSTHYFSGKETAHLFLLVLRWLFAFATRRELYLMHEGIRKLAHVLEFGLFSLAVFQGIRAERRGWKLEWAIITLVVSASYAGLDEWHQSFVPLREARLHDVLIDTTGAFFAQAFVWAYAKLHRNSAGWETVRNSPG